MEQETTGNTFHDEIYNYSIDFNKIDEIVSVRHIAEFFMPLFAQ